jgi:RES domain-containing protein
MASTPEPSAWRIDKAKRANASFTGAGASLEGGRWNPPGVAVVYVSRHLPMAAMEKLVHLRRPVSTTIQYVAFRVFFRGVDVEIYPRERLPLGWDCKPPNEETQDIGLAWALEKRSAILEVPSAILPYEANYLLNPAHPDFHRLEISAPEPFAFDPRLLLPN